MKTIGLLGGMSWESTVSYYQLINKSVKAKLGGFHSAKICLYSVNFAEIEKLQQAGKWEDMAGILARAAHSLEAGGADFCLLCTNTMHKVAPKIESAMEIPLLHIVDTTANKLQQQGIRKVGLLGTRFTMEEDFYKERLSRHGLDVVIPTEKDRQLVHQVIYQELCLGKIKSDSRKSYIEIIEKLRLSGVEGVILGCTEIALLLEQTKTTIPMFDTTQIHAEAAVEFALSESLSFL